MLRSVNESVRSHYGCSDLERIFEVQPRSAQMLMGLMPTVKIGKMLLVEREALAGLLARLYGAQDPAQELETIRREGKPAIVRRKLRELIQQDLDADATVLPPNVDLEPGVLTVRFQTVEELAASLWRLSMLLDADLEGFAKRYEPASGDLDGLEVSEAERSDAAWIREFLAGRA